MRFEKRASKCPSHGEQSYRAGEPIVGDLTFQRLAMIISWVCFGLTILLWLALVVPHLRRYKFPNKQRQMFRIVTTPLIYSLFALASIYAYDAAPYLEQVPELYEAYALASLFLLYVHYVTPDTWTRNEFFHNLDRVSRGKVKAGGSLKWFRRAWRIIFFYVLIYTILFIVREAFIGSGFYCSTSSKPKFPHIWITVIEFILTVWALIVVIRFQRRLKSFMTGRNAMLKLISFKLFILVTTLQNFIFNILKTQVHGSSKMTYQDLTIGLPTLLLCIEGFLFTLSFHFTFHAKEFNQRVLVVKENPVKAFIRALGDASNPWDIIQGIWLAFTSFWREWRRSETAVSDSGDSERVDIDRTIEQGKIEPVSPMAA